MFYEGSIGSASGQAQIAPSDVADVTNSANSPGRIAINYRATINRPDWVVLLHEMFHNMGAVQNGAPESTGAGHCNVDADIMCYADGGPTGQATTSRCEYTELDCGGDTYFNAGTPAPGSWLASHWNLASPNNLFLDHGADTIDGVAPTPPGQPIQGGATVRSVTLSWAPSEDDTAIARYHVERLVSGGTWSEVSTSTTATAVVAGMQPGESGLFRVVAEDPSANRSVPGPSVTATSLADTTPPDTPVAPVVQRVTSNRLEFAWPAASDDVAVASYRVVVRDGATWSQVATVAAADRTFALSGLAPLASREVALQAVDAAGNVSPRSPSTTASTLPDSTAPEDPAVDGFDPFPLALTVRWRGVTDESGIATYVVDRQVPGGGWVEVVRTTSTSATLTGLTEGTNYVLRVRAIDAAGNQSVGARQVNVFTTRSVVLGGGTVAVPPAIVPPVPRPPRDSAPPTTPSGFRLVRATSTAVSFSWRRSSDAASGVRSYVVWAKAGARWLRRGQVTQPSGARQLPAFTLRSLARHSRTLVGVQAVDHAGNVSPRATWWVRTVG